MAKNTLSPETLAVITKAQKQENTEYAIYTKFAGQEKDAANRKLLYQIAAEEKKHYIFWKEYTKKPQWPDKLSVFIYIALAKTLGISFALKLMEKGERNAQELYKEIKSEVPEAKNMVKQEEKHENELLSLINEKRLSYIGSIVLGLNDALVELTGALAGLTLALQNARLVAVAGLITGIAASFSMAASEYLSTKTEKPASTREDESTRGGNKKDPVTAAIFTGIAYIITVTLLITPYLILANLYLSLGLSLAIAILIILFFTFYTSVAQDRPFTSRFLEMAGLSMGVALLTFVIGYVVRSVLHIEL